MDERLWSTGDDRLVITVRGETDAVVARALQLRLVVLVGEAPQAVSNSIPRASTSWTVPEAGR